MRVLCCVLLWLMALCVSAPAHATNPQITLPKSRLEANELAVIINRQDDLSVRIGRYYAKRRAIPAENVIEVDFTPRSGIGEDEFRRIYRSVGERLPKHIQAFALAWMRPYKAGCMSITMAFATGYDQSYCAAKTCAPTRQSPYFGSLSHNPVRDHGMRPAMLLAARDFTQAKALIERGIAADGSLPTGTAYLVSTTDRNRNVRAVTYPQVVAGLGDALGNHIVETDALRGRNDVLFYFTGRAQIDDIDSNRYLPGAMADHLTSAGGILDGTGQMSSLRWLEAGATGSYGTVVEPCNFLQKFPLPGLAIQTYMTGETLIEAYWKSVAWPAEGVFIGEPLAAPFSGTRIEYTADGPVLHTATLYPGSYRVLGSPSPVGPFTLLTHLDATQPGMRRHPLPPTGHPYVTLRRLPFKGPSNTPRE